MAPAASSIDSTDSYNGDDARHYLYELDEALGHHWEVTQETEHLEAALAASQTALAIVEGESSAARARLADSNARVVGRTLKRNPALSPSLFYHVLLDDSFSFHFIPDRGIGGPPTGGEQCCQGLKCLG